MSNTKSFIAQLREAVWPLHEQLEKASPLASVAQGTAPREGYGQALALLYGFVDPLEERIQHCLSQDPVSSRDLAPYHTDSWRRSQLLEKDLRFLYGSGYALHELPRCCKLPQLDTRPQALGSLYVLEGSRLGGQVIADAVRQSLGLTASSGCAYFSGNGQDPGPVWRHFKTLLQAHADAHGKTIVAAAKDCFVCIESWFSGAGNAPETRHHEL